MRNDAKTLSDPLWHNRYRAYLKTDAWAKKRDFVLERARGVCEGCGTARATTVHHLTYEHAGDEFLWELRAVCEACHDKAHPGHAKKAAVAPATLRQARTEMGPRAKAALVAIEEELAKGPGRATPMKRPDLRPAEGSK